MNIGERIDLAARTMTEAHPSADFRARVLAALPARRSRPWPRVAIPVAAAVLVGTVAWLAGANAQRTLVPAAPGIAPVSTTALSPVLVPVVPAVPVVPVEDPAWRARAVSGLVPPDALVFERIQPKALSIAPITMEPIAPPDPIALAAIDSRAGR